MQREHDDAPDRATVWVLEDKDEFRLTVQNVVNGTTDLQCPETFGTAEYLFAHMADHFAPEVMLVDIGLPGLDGIEAVRRMHGFSPATELVMLTIHQDDDRVFRAICAGATGYLVKGASVNGSSMDPIVDAIRSALRGGSPMSPEIARRVLNQFRQIKAPRWDYQLTDRERDILTQIAAGRSKKQIAAALQRSAHTIDTHIRNVYSKLQVHNRTSAVAKALREKLV